MQTRDGFNAKDYVDVAERIRAFYEKYPDGSIQTEMSRLEGDMVVFKATVYRDRQDERPTTGWAYEREGQGYVNRTSFIENCETSAIGRALANLNFPTSRSAAERAAQEAPATGAQIDEIRALAASDTVVEEVRERITARIEAGMTSQQAADAIAYLRRTRRKRGAAA